MHIAHRRENGGLGQLGVMQQEVLQNGSPLKEHSVSFLDQGKAAPALILVILTSPKACPFKVKEMPKLGPRMMR